MNYHLPRQGIFLIEFLIYLVAMIFIVSCSVTGIYQLYKPMIILFQENQKLITAFGAMHLIKRDIEQAPSHKTAWKKISDNELIWTRLTEDIGWQFQDQKLILRKGNYHDGKWHKKTTASLVCKSFHEFSFSVIEKDGYIKGMMIQANCDKSKKQNTHYIALRNSE